MESLVKKRVRLQNKFSKSFLIACNDRQSVQHVSLDNTKPKPENSIWLIKSENRSKSVRLKSVYGKFLGYSPSKGLTICQVKKSAEGYHSWWVLEDVDNSALTSVRIGIQRNDGGAYLYGEPNTPSVMLGKADFSCWSSWLAPERLFQWDLEIVETPTPTPAPALALTQTPKPTMAIDGTPTARCIIQIQQLTVSNIARESDGMPRNLLPFSNHYLNSGRNVNGSGTQIVGGVTVENHIEHMENKTVVRYDALPWHRQKP
ncbi:hypothetical protein RND81_12G216000 [Saponaria officinalis]|uniref:DUF569 domain-containing protein n=1 Tax=Saponaria officinalis TaxID=3572 RepID=A0AAW1HDR7_SAPOF